jgi:hypothetical protein
MFSDRSFQSQGDSFWSNLELGDSPCNDLELWRLTLEQPGVVETHPGATWSCEDSPWSNLEL